jgi:hypothetical protein
LKPQPGDLVEVRARRDAVTARLRPERGLLVMRGMSAGQMPRTSLCLYVGTVSEAAPSKIGPFSWKKPGLSFHCVLWEGKAAWVSSEDADVNPIP